MATTIGDVARRARVSTATVSRVLAGHGRARPETRERVFAAARDLGYRPSGVARSLRQRATRTLGLIVTDIENPFFPQLVRAVEDAARDLGYAILLCNADDDPEREVGVPRAARRSLGRRRRDRRQQPRRPPPRVARSTPRCRSSSSTPTDLEIGLSDDRVRQLRGRRARRRGTSPSWGTSGSASSPRRPRNTDGPARLAGARDALSSRRYRRAIASWSRPTRPGSPAASGRRPTSSPRSRGDRARRLQRPDGDRRDAGGPRRRTADPGGRQRRRVRQRRPVGVRRPAVDDDRPGHLGDGPLGGHPAGRRARRSGDREGRRGRGLRLHRRRTAARRLTHVDSPGLARGPRLDGAGAALTIAGSDQPRPCPPAGRRPSAR